MIEYAGATLLGCTIITDKGNVRSTTWRNAHAEQKKISKVEIVSTSGHSYAQHAAFLILTACESRHYNKAMYRLIDSGKKLTTFKLACEVQKVEREETRVTGKSKESSDVDNVYDGRIVSWDDKADEGYVADVDTRHYNYTQLQGKKGRKDNILRLASIPPRRAAALDANMMTIRLRMLALREWWLNTPSAKKYGPAF